MWCGDGNMGWMGIWGFLGLAILVVLVWALLRASGGLPAARESPEQILKRRYASGEIDRETYQRMFTDLKGEGHVRNSR